jgi:probable phosphoglycerate mutase
MFRSFRLGKRFLPWVTGLLTVHRSFFVASWTTVPNSILTNTIDAQTRHRQPRLLSLWSHRNHLESMSSLKNNYFALRHGQSKANVAKIIASNPDVATLKYGLSDLGTDQATNAGKTIVEEFQSQQYDGVLILSSDLLRAKETAEIAAEAVKDAQINLFSNDVIVETRLRERGFGEWDGGSDDHYNDVWLNDANDPTHTAKGVESVMSVTDRASKMILEWDQQYENHMVICVAHGDVLQILQTAFCKMDGSLHRTLEHLETATLRNFALAQYTFL